ncbi:general transcription factor 3C polypeptide 6 [Trichomycterus rosablanca]|uniref:general transcription factor 3C polypeptide 6 n=1 Tax=Trichomycterus rosablanca TaxID=2290929 RepID=UPI002F351024
MEDEWDEEEQVVVAELSGMINSDVLSGPGGVCKIVGMSTEQPILQLGRYVFAGQYEDSLGTCVIFEEHPQDQAGSDQNPALQYKCHTTKKLMLQRTFLYERKEGEASTGGIEILSLNEGEMGGRANTVCHYGLDPTETQGPNTGDVISDDSDIEITEAGESSVMKDGVTETPQV